MKENGHTPSVEQILEERLPLAPPEFTPLIANRWAFLHYANNDCPPTLTTHLNWEYYVEDYRGIQDKAPQPLLETMVKVAEKLTEKSGLTLDQAYAEFNKWNESVQPVSFNYILSKGKIAEFGELIPDNESVAPDEIACASEKSRVINELLSQLPERERLVLEMRLGFTSEPRTLKETGKELGMSRNRAGQLEKQAMKRLKQPHVLQRLAQLLD